MNDTASIRRSLQWNLIDLLVILALGAATLSFLAQGRAARRLSRSLLEQALGAAQARLSGLFDPVNRELASLADEGLGSRLELDDRDGPGGPDRLLHAFLRQHAWVVAARVADDRGREFLLQHSGEAWRSRRVLDPDGSGRVVWSDWLGDSSAATQRDEVLEYDPRTNAWFIGAALNAGSDEPHWTAAYPLPSTGELGFTASQAFEIDGHTRVVAFDMGLSAVSTLTAGWPVADGGGVFVLDEGDRILGLPHAMATGTSAQPAATLLQRPEDLESGIVRDASAVLLPDATTEDPRRFRSGGARWWGQLRRFDLSTQRPLWIVAVVPRAELTGEFAWQRRWLGALAAFLLGVAWLRAGWLATRYGKPEDPGTTMVI